MFRFSIRDVLWLMVVVGLAGIAQAQQPQEPLQKYDDIERSEGWLSSVLEHYRQLRELGAKSEWEEKQDKRLEKWLPAKKQLHVPSLRFPANIERAMQSDCAPRSESRI